MQYELSFDSFTEIPFTSGTIQNINSQATVEVSTTDTPNTGIILYPGEKYEWSDATIYARAAWGNGETVMVAAETLVAGSGGGGGGYVLPTATATRLGGVKIGTGLQVSNTGVIDFLDGAPQHNCFYRGKDLTAYMNSGGMSAAIANGTFTDIYPGDYVTKSITIDGTTYSNVKFIIMDLDYHLHCGDTETTAHHVVIMPEERLGVAQMNTENTTAGGYLGSKMWTEHMPKVTAGLEAAFGAAHILEHRELLSIAVDANVKSNAYAGWSGAASNWAWTSVKANLANEDMVYGAPVVSSSLYDTGECNAQLAAFRLNHELICSNRYWWWLRSVAAGTHFCDVDGYGYASNTGAGGSGGVRPYFLYY